MTERVEEQELPTFCPQAWQGDCLTVCRHLYCPNLHQHCLLQLTWVFPSIYLLSLTQQKQFSDCSLLKIVLGTWNLETIWKGWVMDFFFWPVGLVLVFLLIMMGNGLCAWFNCIQSQEWIHLCSVHAVYLSYVWICISFCVKSMKFAFKATSK